MICIPIIFKDDIKKLVLKEVNKSLKADVSIQDIDLTFISTFPAITIELSNVKVIGRTAFKGVELAAIKSFSAPMRDFTCGSKDTYFSSLLSPTMVIFSDMMKLFILRS